MTFVSISTTTLYLALEALKELLPDPKDSNHDGHDARDVRSWRHTAGALETVLKGSEQRLVPVPEGVSQSDAEFWLSKRAEIIDACKTQGFTIVTTANGVQLMRLGQIEAQAEPRQPVHHLEQEPVAWMGVSGVGEVIVSKTQMFPFMTTPLYTHPPRREWQGLSEEEMDEFLRRFARYELIRVIEQALKEKNHG